MMRAQVQQRGGRQAARPPVDARAALPPLPGLFGAHWAHAHSPHGDASADAPEEHPGSRPGRPSGLRRCGLDAMV